jgi:hypothetical protein
VALSLFPTKGSIYFFFFTQGHSVTVPGVPCGILKPDKITNTVFAVIRLTAGPPATLTLTSIGRHLQCNQHFVPNAGRVCVWHWVPERDTIRHHPEIEAPSLALRLTSGKQTSNSGPSSYYFNAYSIFSSHVQNGYCGAPLNTDSYITSAI